MQTNRAYIASKAIPTHLTFFNKEYATVNTVTGSIKFFCKCDKPHWDLRSLREEKPLVSERLIVKKELRTLSRSHC